MASAAKSAAKREEAEEGGEEQPAPPKKARGPLLLILGSAVLSAALASGVTWFLAPKHAPAAHGHAAAREDAKEGAKDAKEDGKDEAKASDDGEQKSGPQEAALYLDLTPAFVVNLADEEAVRFLQVEAELMARDPKVIDAAKANMPRIRNTILLLLSQQHSHDLASREAKENLQKQALAEVQKALQEENAPAEIGAVYFTSFVIQ
jgi:flagellar FliL protein